MNDKKNSGHENLTHTGTLKSTHFSSDKARCLGSGCNEQTKKHTKQSFHKDYGNNKLVFQALKT